MFKGWTEESIEALLQKRRQPLRDLERQMERAPVPAAVSSTQANATGAQTKYRNRKVTDASGVLHDSKSELARWEELKLMERAGEIRHLRRQVPFALVVGGVLVCTYVADFVYEVRASRGQDSGGEFVPGSHAATIVEDCKSPPTRKLAAYRIKAKLMQAIHGLQIREV